MGAGKVAPAPVRAVPLNPPAELPVPPLLLLHAAPSTTTTSAAAATAPNLPNLLMLPPCDGSPDGRTGPVPRRSQPSPGGASRGEGVGGPRIPSRGSRGLPRLLGLGIGGRPLARS